MFDSQRKQAEALAAAVEERNSDDAARGPAEKPSGRSNLENAAQSPGCKADERRGEGAYVRLRNRAEAEDNAADGVFGHVSRRLYDTFLLVEASFQPPPALVERILAGAAERSVRQPNIDIFRGRRQWRLGVVAGAIVLIVVSLSFVKPSAPTAGAIVTKALAVIEQPDKITYYRLSGKSITRFGESATSEEHWVDHKNHRAKEQYRTGGRLSVELLVRDGKSISIERSESQADISESKALAPFSDWLKDSVSNYRQAIEGRSSPVDEETINGIATFRLREELPAEDVGRVDKRKMKQIETINIRKDNFQPLRIASETLLVSDDGKTEVDTAEVKTVREVRLIEAAAIKPDLFSLEIPPDAPYRVNNVYTLDEAKDFKDFDLFYLGRAFAGFGFDGGLEHESTRNDKYALKGLPNSRVTIHYANAAGDDGLSIIIWPSFDPNILIRASFPTGLKTELNTNGSKVSLIETNWGRQVSRAAIVQKGSSVLLLEAKEKDVLVKAANELIKIN